MKIEINLDKPSKDPFDLHFYCPDCNLWTGDEPRYLCLKKGHDVEQWYPRSLLEKYVTSPTNGNSPKDKR